MKNKNNKQQGSAIIIIEVILSLAIIGIVGFIIWQNFIQIKTTGSLGSNSSSITEIKKTTSESLSSNSSDELASTPASDDNEYERAEANFTIEYWSVKGAYNGVHSIDYSISNNEILFFNSKDLPESCTSGVARIKRFAADEYTHGYPAMVASDNIDDKKASIVFAKNSYSSTGGNKKVGGYYYVLTTPMQYCAEPGSEVLQKAIFVDILNYFKSLRSS